MKSKKSLREAFLERNIETAAAALEAAGLPRGAVDLRENLKLAQDLCGKSPREVAMEEALASLVQCCELQRDVIEQGKHKSAWNTALAPALAALQPLRVGAVEGGGE